MRIGIIVHSKTGNTRQVAQRLQKALIEAGHEVSLEQTTALDDRQRDAAKMELSSIPDVNYDVLIFGAPVWAFSLSTVMTAYLSRIESLAGEKALCFVTQSFPFPWLGGNRAIGQMRKICESKGAEVMATGIISWSKKQREDRIDEMINRFAGLFSAGNCQE